MRHITIEIHDRETTPGRDSDGRAYMQEIPVREDDGGARLLIRDHDTGQEIGLLHVIDDPEMGLLAAVGGWDRHGDWLPNQAGGRSWLVLANRQEDEAAEAAYREMAETDPTIDTESSVSRQHYIDTGNYLTVAEVAEIREHEARRQAATA